MTPFLESMAKLIKSVNRINKINKIFKQFSRYSLGYLVHVNLHKFHNPFMIRSITIMLSTALHDFKSIKGDLDCLYRLITDFWGHRKKPVHEKC